MLEDGAAKPLKGVEALLDLNGVELVSCDGVAPKLMEEDCEFCWVDEANIADALCVFGVSAGFESSVCAGVGGAFLAMLANGFDGVEEGAGVLPDLIGVCAGAGSFCEEAPLSLGYDTSSDDLDAPKLKPEDAGVGSAGFAPKTLEDAGEAGLNWNIFDGAAGACEAGVSPCDDAPLERAGLVPNGLVGVVGSAELALGVVPNPLKPEKFVWADSGLLTEEVKSNDEAGAAGVAEKEREGLGASGLLGLRTNSSIFFCASAGSSLRLSPARDVSCNLSACFSVTSLFERTLYLGSLLLTIFSSSSSLPSWLRRGPAPSISAISASEMPCGCDWPNALGAMPPNGLLKAPAAGAEGCFAGEEPNPLVLVLLLLLLAKAKPFVLFAPFIPLVSCGLAGDAPKVKPPVDAGVDAPKLKLVGAEKLGDAAGCDAPKPPNAGPGGKL